MDGLVDCCVYVHFRPRGDHHEPGEDIHRGCPRERLDDALLAVCSRHGYYLGGQMRGQMGVVVCEKISKRLADLVVACACAGGVKTKNKKGVTKFRC